MKKLLTALAVVAGLGFVVSCSDEVSEYTLINEEPTLGTFHERTGTLTGTYEYVHYEDLITEKPDTLSEYESTTVEGVTIWYKKITEKTDFSTANAKLTWTVSDKSYSSKSGASDEVFYLNDKDTDYTTYKINFDREGIDYSNFSYSVTGRTATNKSPKDGVSTLVAGEVGVQTTTFNFKKVGKTYIYTDFADSDVSEQFTGGIEDKTFTIAKLVASEDVNDVWHAVFKQNGDFDYGKTITTLGLVDTVTYSNLKFTRY